MALTRLHSLPLAAACTGATVLLGGLLASPAAASPFATRVLSYDPAPGQNVQNPAFSDPTRALGAPVGGGATAADNTKLVTLGGFGGSITLGFDHAIANHAATAANPLGLDFIIFGNAFFVAGNPSRRWAEAAVVFVSRDANGNGLADDPWYVIPGSHLPAAAAGTVVPRTWDSDTVDGTNPPLQAAWVPPGRTGVWTTSAPLLPALFNGPVVSNPLGLGSGEEGIFGYADCSPTLMLGDLDGDGIVDDQSLGAETFYTRPDNPLLVGIDPGSGGGDAIDIGWAVDAGTGKPAELTSIDFVRIVCAVDRVNATFGEASTEIGGLAEVVIASRRLADLVGPGGDPPGDGTVDGSDFIAFINAFAAELPLADVAGGDPTGGSFGDGTVDGSDFIAFINSFAEGN